jgi:hypothetical protein
MHPRVWIFMGHWMPAVSKASVTDRIVNHVPALLPEVSQPLPETQRAVGGWGKGKACMSMQAQPGQPGWLPDPTGRFESRYWDGTSWTQGC